MIDTFIGQTLADKYRIDAFMRETDLGAVYHGTHLLMEKPVTIKILSPALAADENFVDRFSAEARALSHISHPNILNVTDFGKEPRGAVFIVFEDAEGETLKEIIRRDGFFAPERAVSIAKQIAAALSAAHIKNVVHRNLSSENVLLTAGDAVKVLDLGTVKTGAGTDEFSAGNIEYLSPEQCADPAAASERSDIYALGVILYEMLAGEVPFRGETRNELMLKHAQEPPAPLLSFRQDLPPELEPVVLQALAKNPEMRHRTAAEFIDDLNRVGRHFGENAAIAAATPTSNNNIWKTAFVVLAGISLLSMGLIWTLGGFEKRTDPSTQLFDPNAQPVQPINPATGMNEQGLATIVPVTQDSMSNSNAAMVAPDTLPGGDGYNPWGNGIKPPAGAPTYVPPGGETINIGNTGSPFMADEPGTIYRGKDGNLYMIVPPNPNANVNVNAKTQPSPKTTKTPAANTAVQPTPAPNETPKPQASPSVQPKTEKTPAKPTEKPKSSPSTTTQSGKTQDTE